MRHFFLNNDCYDNQGNVVFLVTIETVAKDKKVFVNILGCNMTLK